MASRTARTAFFAAACGIAPAMATVPTPEAKPAPSTELTEFATTTIAVPVPADKPLRGFPPAKPAQTRLPPQALVLSQHDREAGKRAMQEAAAGRFEAARRLAAKAKDPLVGDLVQWQWLQSPSGGASFEAIAEFIEKKPDWPARNALLRRAEESVDASAGDERILAWFAAHPPLTGLGMLRYSEALARQGRSEDAFEVLRKAWIKGNLPLKEEKAVWTQFGRRFTEEDNAARVDRLLWDGNVTAASRMLPRLTDTARQLAAARIAFAKNHPKADRLAAALPPGLRDNGGLAYERLRWQRGRGKDEIVEALLYNAPEDLGRPERWWSERHLRARKAIAEGRVSEAYRLAAGHGLSDGAAFAEAEWLAGWIALRLLQEPTTALRHFTALADNVSYPISVARAAYWLGRAYTALGSGPEARIWYSTAAQHSTTYYGQLAAYTLDVSQPLRFPKAVQPSSEAREKFESREVVRAARILMELDEEDQLRPFILHLVHTAESPEDHKLTADLARDLRRVDLAVMSSKRSAWKNVVLVHESYPLVEPMLRTEVPETALVLAVSRQESEFNQFAMSSAGARGLMQLMPATAKQLAARLKIGFQPAKLTNDAGYNVRLGSHYLNNLLRNWSNNYVLALAAYNAGEGRVRRWIQEWGDPRDPKIDVIDWIELIPFSETRNYVQRVLEGVQVYRALLATEPVSLDRLHVDLRGAPQQVCGATTC